MLCVLLLAALLTQNAPVFGPPEVPADAAAQLRGAGVRSQPYRVTATRLGGAAICAVPGGVSVTRGGSGIRYRRPVRVNGAFALRLVRFEKIVQEEAAAAFGRRVVAIEHLGTYVCRMMAAYPDWVSEHSFGNAIDVSAFALAGGRQITVARHWIAKDKESDTSAARFLRRLGRRLYDEDVFSVVLTPTFDRRHHNHFHLDGAAYRVDGN